MHDSISKRQSNGPSVCQSIGPWVSRFFFRSRKSTNLTNRTDLTPSNLTESYKSDKSDKPLIAILS